MVRACAGLLFFVAFTGCGASESDPGLGPATIPTHGARFVIGPPLPTLFVAVVDDRPDAAELRAAVAKAFEQYDEAKNSHGCRGRFDPAAFHPDNRSVIAVHPSASGNALLTTELEQPGLRWVTNQPSEAEHAAWVAEVTRALEPKEATQGAFAPLAAMKRLIPFLTRQRPPETAQEIALAAVLPKDQWVYPTLAATHDDESSEPAAALAAPPDNRLYYPSIIVPGLVPSPVPLPCANGSGSTTARYSAWLDALPKYTAMDIMYWPCTEPPLVQFLEDTCTGGCLSFTPPIADDGSVDCHVTVDTIAPSCDKTYGWLDPTRPDGTSPPQTVEVDGVTLRRCEVRQLTGAALDSCVHSLECPDCVPGWCYTQVPDFLTRCEANPNAFRFVAGADSAASAYVNISCRAAP